MFKSVIALFFCALSITVTANPLNTMDFFDCGSSSDLMPVKALKIMPFPPKIGDTLTVVAAGALKEVNET